MKFIRFLFIAMAFSGLLAQTPTTLPYASMSEMGLDSSFVYQKIDSIITNGIKQEAFPGATILAAHQGKIIFHKAYGYHTYDSITPVDRTDLYDLASVTKVTAALPALMKLVEEGKLDLDKPFSTYWKPWQHRKDKKGITLREILAHQSGLAPYIVFLDEVVKKGKIKKRFVHTSPKSKFTHQAYEGLYVRNNFNRKMYRQINRSKIGEKKYLYSGQTFLIFPQLIEQLTGQDYQTYLHDNFYGPLGSTTMGFLPKTHHYPNNIVPTEVDTLFRHTLTQGWVHDENAALLGGVSGNAGLFASAIDLFNLMQMYQNMGEYNGKRYFKKATLEEFTRVQYPENDNRRGLGFDKPLFGNDTLALKDAYPAPEVDASSFGHSGFTGTFVWADPEKDLVYIFLSNRVYPSREHRQLYDLNIRSAVQEVFYQALETAEQKEKP